MAIKGLFRTHSSISHQFGVIKPKITFDNGVYLYVKNDTLFTNNAARRCTLFTNNSSRSCTTIVYHIMLIKNGKSIKFKTIIIPKEGDNCIRFVGMETEHINNINYKRVNIQFSLVNTFLERQYLTMVKLSFQDLLSYNIYKNTREELKLVLEFFNKFIKE